MIQKDTISLIKETATDNIVEVIGDFVELKKRGSQWVGLSPFSNERTPSFYVNKSKGFFKCFSSGKGGDVISFLGIKNDWDFIQCLKYLGKRFGIDIQDNDFEFVPKSMPKPEVKHPSYIHPDIMLASKVNYDNNPLFKYLTKKIGNSISGIFDMYHVGCFNDWVIFWQLDINTYVRSGKFIKYLDTGKRCKETKATWEHVKTIEYVPVYKNFNLVQCFFGEHLIMGDVRKPIAIVESEKTAMVATHYMPNYYWLACGSKMGLNDVKCEVLANRSVTLFPDIGCYNDWKQYAVKYGYNISDKFERIATPSQTGWDIADFLLM